MVILENMAILESGDSDNFGRSGDSVKQNISFDCQIYSQQVDIKYACNCITHSQM